MKYLLMTLAVVMIFAAPALAADRGNLSQDNLAKMGLSGMTVMSDVQGTSVRGMGFALAYGASYAKTHNAGTVNGYLAAGNTVAAGANLSVAGSAGSGWFGSTNWSVVGAGGASVAFAH
jgi:hypothetical protein